MARRADTNRMRIDAHEKDPRILGYFVGDHIIASHVLEGRRLKCWEGCQSIHHPRFCPLLLCQESFPFRRIQCVLSTSPFCSRADFQHAVERSAVFVRQRSLVHLIGEQTSRLERRFDGLRVIVFPAYNASP